MHMLRTRLNAFIDHPKVRYTILGIIIINAALLGLETVPSINQTYGPLLIRADQICLAIFVVELVIKLFAKGVRFFRDPWNIFDFLVVAISLAPASEGLSVLRALRVLRVFRVLSYAPRLRRVIEGFIAALPGMGSVFLLMTIIFYIASVIATKLFGHDFPNWFGSIGHSAYSLFQIMTLESWSMGIVRPVMEKFPYAWAFFVPFILVTTFAVVNLIVGLIVNSMQEAHSEEELQATDAHRKQLLERLDEITKRLDRLERQKTDQ